MVNHNCREVGGESSRRVVGLLQKFAVLTENDSLLAELEKLLSTLETESTRKSARTLGIGQDRLLRLKEVLELVPVSRSTWYSGVKSGRYPSPVHHLGPRISAWPLFSIMQLLNGGQP